MTLLNWAVSHLLETSDPLSHRGMRAEELHEGAAPQRIDDEHVCGGRTGVHRNTLRPGFQLLECTRQRHRVPTNASAGRIRLIFPRTRDGHLNEHCRNG